jgi:hypothetical protein
MGWQSKFQDNTTNVAFHLTLSRRMIQAFEMCRSYHDGTDPHKADFGHFISAVRALIDRGLVEHHDLNIPKSITVLEDAQLRRNHRWYTLTPAGELVWQLCIIADLVKARPVMEKVA